MFVARVHRFLSVEEAEERSAHFQGDVRAGVLYFELGCAVGLIEQVWTAGPVLYAQILPFTSWRGMNFATDVVAGRLAPTIVQTECRQ